VVEHPVMTDARAEILAKVRVALADVPSGEAPSDVRVDRLYLTTDPDPESRVDRFIERVSEYRATVHRVETDALPATIASICRSRGIRRLVLPRDIPKEWIPAELIALSDDTLSNAELNTSDGVLTGCALGIAQTGTIVLDRGTYQGRRALTLLPDYHLCVIREDQIVGMVPEAVTALESASGRPDRPMTWISGPSATSDIELNRVEGVHGPRTLEVLVVGGQGG
jgi:L-lactate dehydrogenase complex protein LldG